MSYLSRAGTCCKDGCDQPIQAKRLCKAHYAAWYRAHRQTLPCKIEGCGKPSAARGWCAMHYWRWKKNGDPLVTKTQRIDHTQSKQCAECGVTFHCPSRRSAAQWVKMQCCTSSCANALKARGRPKAIGDLSRRDLGSKTAWTTEWQRRKAMPAWAAWWQDKRRAEDLADLATVSVVYGRGAQRLNAKPQSRRFISRVCQACGAMWVSYEAMPDTTYCAPCNKRRWSGSHKRRAEMYGVEWEDIAPSTIFARDKKRCQICGCKTRGKFPAPTSATIDHIVPISKDGPHLIHNLQTACLRCNLQKHDGAANDQLRLDLEGIGRDKFQKAEI